MATPPRPSRAIFPAVLPQAPKEYSQDYFFRLIDILQKALEQLSMPRQLVIGNLILTETPLETPRTAIPGEVYAKDCPTCAGRVLMIKAKEDAP
jgi:hypothetical protein